MSKPVLKWVGGKTQIATDVLALFPSTMNNYHEPFIGGASILLSLLERIKEGSIVVQGAIYASDVNPTLIMVYRCIQFSPSVFIAEVRKILAVFESLHGTEVNRKPTTLAEAYTSQQSYYYWIRTQFNAVRTSPPTLTSAAMFLFLNKTCFRGVYREGPKGFNVPFGHYKTTPTVLDDANIYAISTLIQHVVFTVCDYADALARAVVGDFVYLDPPYAPQTASSFVTYTESGFGLEKHTNLFAWCTSTPVKFLLSNAQVPLVTSAFPAPTYTTRVITCRRAINSKNPSATASEVLITN